MAVVYPDGEFAVAFTRMPFLAALMEFLISVLGYGDLDGVFRAGPEFGLTGKSVDGSANELARLLYGWLAPQLPSTQSQRKFRAVMSFLRRNGGTTPRPDDIDDDTVLAFWISASVDDSASGDFKSFRTVFHLMVGVRDALTAAAVHGAMTRARPIGGDREAGEIDPGIIDAAAVDAALGVLHERLAPLEVLAAPPAKAVKFLKNTEADAVRLVVEAGDAAHALPLSMMRVQVQAAVQVKISQALRRGDSAAVGRLLEGSEDDAEDYGQRRTVLASIHDHLRQVILASLHHLLRARHDEAITVLLHLHPDIDLSPFAALFPAEQEANDTVVRLAPPPTGDRFLHAIAADADRCPALGSLIREAGAAARGITRRGFETPKGDDTDPAPFAAAVEPLIALREALGRFLEVLDRVHRDADGWARRYRADRSIFQAQFRALYGDIR